MKRGMSVTSEMCATGATRSDKTSAQSRASRKPRKSRCHTISETIKSATMLMTLIIGLIAGPAVSL